MTTRRRWAALLALAACLCTVLTGAVDANGESELLWLTNNARAQYGLAALAPAADLQAVARRHSADMAASGQLEHNANLPNEVGGWQRLSENVGRGTSIQAIHNAFMASSSHREAILDPGFTEIGVGVEVVNGTYWVTEVFREPEAPAPAPPPPPPPPPPAPAPAPPPPTPAAPVALPAPGEPTSAPRTVLPPGSPRGADLVDEALAEAVPATPDPAQAGVGQPAPPLAAPPALPRVGGPAPAAAPTRVVQRDASTWLQPGPAIWPCVRLPVAAACTRPMSQDLLERLVVPWIHFSPGLVHALPSARW